MSRFPHVLTALTVALSCLPAALAAQPAQPAQLAQSTKPATSARPKWQVDAWLMTSFRGSGDGLHLAVSDDGKTWRDLDRVFLKPTVGSGLMRDPHLMRGPDGIFRLVWTTGWKDKGIGYASSTDLVNWSEQKYLPLFEDVPGTKTAWAPETVYDEASGQYVITWSSDIEGRFPQTASSERMNHRTYYVTTRDFQTFSKPQVLIDPGFDHIDTTLSKVGDQWIAVFKEGDQQRRKIWGAMRWAVADNVLGPYSLMPEPLVRERAEGPTLMRAGDKTRLFVDFYSDGHYGVYETGDWKTWTDVSGEVSVVKGQRHGTVLWVPPWLAKNLETAQADGKPVMPQPAPPPALEGFTADPAIRVFGDTYYLYPTSDKTNWQTTDFSVWTSKNLVDWKKERMVLDVAHDLKWANIEAWAPDAIERNGKYYFYFCAAQRIGVASANSPLGPFMDALGAPLVQKGTGVQTNTIDPYPFIDDDGQAYLYYGNGKIANVYKLKPDMVTLDGPPAGIPLKQFREGIVVFKRGGKYYFMWSIDDARSPDYRVGWGVADSPLGPVRSPDNNFIVLQKHGAAVGTAHHSVVNVPGTDRWYVAYHRHALPQGGGYQRQTVLARMEFDADGNIKPMDPLAAPFKPGDAGEPIVQGRGLTHGENRSFRYDAVVSGVPLYDKRGQPVSAHGANILKDGDTFYLFGEAHVDGSNAFAGVNAYSSKDLTNWTFEGVALPVQPQGVLGPDTVGERPKVMKSPKTGEYVMFIHADAMDYKSQFVGYATSKTITGPYAYQGPLLFEGKPIRKWDMGTFQDRDGAGYVLLHGGDIYRLADDYRSIVEHVNRAMDKGFESPALFEDGGTYYFLGSNLTGWERNDNYYYTAPSLKGPWTRKGLIAPEGTRTWNSQVSFVLPIRGSKGTTYMFMGDRWSFPRQATAASYVWQPLTVGNGEISIPRFQAAWKVDPATGLAAPAAPPAAVAGNTDARIAYRGAWRHEAASVSGEKGAAFSFRFTGTQVGWYGSARPDGGYARVTLSDSRGNTILSSNVDLYARPPGSNLVFLSPVLPRDSYTLEVTVLGENWYWVDKKGVRSGSEGVAVALDKLVFTP